MRAYLRRHGIAIEPNSADHQASAADGALHLLPNSAAADLPVEDRVPIHLHLECDDLSNFERGECYAVTHFGPAGLASDKAQNEDFALAGVIDGPNGPVSFGIVADGVTSKTFWAARASRLATFAAYETVKACVAVGWQPALGGPEEIDPFVQRLCETIEQRFLEDRAALVSADATPLTWDATLYRRHRNQPTFWYQTTLLVVVIGASGGWFVFCGDGGATRLFSDGQTVTDAKVALESPDTVELPAAVTIGVTPRRFKRIFFRPPPADQSVHVVLSSDGIDRSLKNKRTQVSDLDYASLDLSSRSAAQSTIEDIARWPEADRDNMSMAHVCYPPDASWPGRGRAPVDVHRPEPEPVPVSEPPLPPPVPEAPLSWWQTHLPQAGGSAAAALLAGIVIGAMAMLLAVAAGRGSRLLTWLQPRLLAALCVTAFLAAFVVVTLFVPAAVAQRVAAETQRLAKEIWASLQVLAARVRPALGAIARHALAALRSMARQVGRRWRRLLYGIALQRRRWMTSKMEAAEPPSDASPETGQVGVVNSVSQTTSGAPTDTATLPAAPAGGAAAKLDAPAPNHTAAASESRTQTNAAAQRKRSDFKSAGDKL